ncbi:hypothetical protein [Arenivirga flava]|uniref:Uncharacterized protein n=1 Tax=Arenivirga flava TaxID=1930060 RepID=A0AA37XBJ9_9MICO|nr:hypothetical protein [Arenivirga flava]GMA28425.1 hypothetical protein GCM10025874_16780 [Arenivirga flava]
MSDDAAAAQPIWDDAWDAWVVRDPEKPDAWLIWSEALSSWQPLPVGQGAVPPEPPIEDQPEPLPAPVAARFHANGPLRADGPSGDLAGPAVAPGPRRATYEAPIAAAQAQMGTAAHPAPVAPNSWPFVDPSTAQLIAVPAPRSAGGGTAVLALGIAAIGVGALVMLVGLASSSLLALGVGDPGAVRVVVNLLAVLTFPIAVLGVVLGALQLRGGTARHRDRALIGFGVCATVTLMLVARAVVAMANTVLHGYPLL